jgi:hypothetical protein
MDVVEGELKIYSTDIWHGLLLHGDGLTTFHVRSISNS